MITLCFSLDNSELSSLLEVIAGSFGLTIALLLVLLAIDLIRRWYKSRPGRDITGRFDHASIEAESFA